MFKSESRFTRPLAGFSKTDMTVNILFHPHQWITERVFTFITGLQKPGTGFLFRVSVRIYGT
jgi:hypothetical protein